MTDPARRICVLGASGWIGRELMRQSAHNADVFGASRTPGHTLVAASSTAILGAVLRERQVDIVINCVAATS